MTKRVKNISKNIILFILFFTALMFVVKYVLDVLEWKDGYGLKTWDEFYEIPKNSVDVMCYGSSHNMCTINHGIMYNDYGITSASAGGIGLSLRTTYYFMKESFNYQNPKIALVETVYSVWDSEDYTGYEEVMALNQSVERAEFVKELYEDEDNYTDYLLGLPIYHTRYWEISKKDFTGFGQYSLGYYGTWNLYTEGTPRYFPEVTNATPIDEDKQIWLDKIVELCKEKNVELIFYLSPYNAAVTPEEWAKHNWVENYAKERDITMINFNKLNSEINLDFTTDYADNHHLNVYGGAKVTKYIGEFLKANYDLDNHKGESGCEKWENCYTLYLQEENENRLKWESGLENYLKLLDSNNFITAFSFIGSDWDRMLQPEHIEAFEQLGIKKDILLGLEEGIIIVSQDKILYKTNDTQDIYSFTDDGCDFWVRVDKDGNKSENNNEEMIIDGFNCTYTDEGIYAVTYSRLTGKSIDSAFFSPYNELNKS